MSLLKTTYEIAIFVELHNVCHNSTYATILYTIYPHHHHCICVMEGFICGFNVSIHFV